MKKLYLLIFTMLVYLSGIAQNNTGFKYQAIIRDAAGNINANASVNMEISILQGTADGTAVFIEIHEVTSNAYGLVNLTIGSQNPTDFDLIDWANGPYFIKIVVDGVEFGTSQLLSVPYALHAKTAESFTGTISETDPLFSASTAANITQTQIEDWTNKLSEFAESDPNFDASIASSITQTDLENWNNKLSEFVESDPEFAASLAKGISATDTAYWNSKLDNFVETDPEFMAHPSAGITANDISKWKALWIWYTTNSKGYLTSEVDGSVSNEIQVLSISNDTIYLEDGGFVKLPASTTSLNNAYQIGDTITANSGPVFINGTGGIISTGTYEQGATLADPENGPQMIWYPRKSAFRVGYDQWNSWTDNNIGDFSFAGGVNSNASGEGAIAFGTATTSSGSASIAMGNASHSSGYASTAFGNSVSVSGDYSAAMGFFLDVDGNNSIAIGSQVKVTGEGSIYFGDHSLDLLASHTEPNNNRFTARFDNGYYLFTRSDLATGVFMNNGGIAWIFMSDKNKKENFRTVDGEEVLGKIRNIDLSSWNIIGQDPSTDRHYGPMAQDFYAAFGYDGVGTVGNDTSICTSDFDGINLIGIKALELRTSKNTYLIEQLKEKEYELDEANLKIINLEQRLIVLEKITKQLINANGGQTAEK